MKALNHPPHGIVVFGIIAGSFAGALLRAVALLMMPIQPESTLVRSLFLSALGGALLGAPLGAALQRRASGAWQLPLGIALIAAIGSFGAAAAVELVAKEATPWPFWRDAVLNIGVTILAARAALMLVRRRYPR
jgi:hypothetical protein